MDGGVAGAPFVGGGSDFPDLEDDAEALLEEELFEEDEAPLEDDPPPLLL